MEKLQENRAHSNVNSRMAARMQENMRDLKNSGGQQLHELTRLRIERNRAARHARCAIIGK